MGAGRPAKRQRREEPLPLASAPTTPRTPTTPPLVASCFWKIPLELRLQIYDYALSDVTITVGEQERNIFGSSVDIDNNIVGLPTKYVPLVLNRYDADLFKIGKMPIAPYQSLVEDTPVVSNALAGVSMDSGYGSFSGTIDKPIDLTTSLSPAAHTPASVTHVSLLQTNKQLREEVLAHMDHPTCTPTTLYVNYPYGLLVLKKHYPSLIKHVNNIVVSGTYNPSNLEADRSNSSSEPPTMSKATQLVANKTLERFTRTLFPRTKTTTPEEYNKVVKPLQLRIYYSDNSNHNAVWGDEFSPILTCMRQISAGTFDMKVWRGRTCNGVTLKILPMEPDYDPEQPPPRIFRGRSRSTSAEPSGQPAVSSRSQSVPDIEVVSRSVAPAKWSRITRTYWRRFKGYPAATVIAARARGTDNTRQERFWEVFGDEASFNKEVPEATCWTAT